MPTKPRSKKYGSRLLKDYNERQELGWEKSTQKNIRRIEKEIEKLENKMKPIAVKLELKKKELKDYTSTLKEVHDYIGDFDMVKNREKINVVIVKGKERVRGKVWFYRKWRWFHICQSPLYDEGQRLYYMDMVRKKFIKSLTKPIKK